MTVMYDLIGGRRGVTRSQQCYLRKIVCRCSQLIGTASSLRFGGGGGGGRGSSSPTHYAMATLSSRRGGVREGGSSITYAVECTGSAFGV